MEKCTHLMKSEINKLAKGDHFKVSNQHLFSDALVTWIVCSKQTELGSLNVNCICSSLQVFDVQMRNLTPFDRWLVKVLA